MLALTLMAFDQVDLETSLDSRKYCLSGAPPSYSGGCQATVTEVRSMSEKMTGPLGGEGRSVVKIIKISLNHF